jgi:hypothetical protein
MMTMTEIASCPKCGATVTVEKFEEGDPMGIFCEACGFVYFVPQEIDTVEGLIAAWNSQPVIERLRAEVAELNEAARWRKAPEELPSENQSIWQVEIHWGYREQPQNWDYDFGWVYEDEFIIGENHWSYKDFGVEWRYKRI